MADALQKIDFEYVDSNLVPNIDELEYLLTKPVC